MTPSHIGGQSDFGTSDDEATRVAMARQSLFGTSDPTATRVEMALSGSEHKLIFKLLAEDVVMYVFFAAQY